MKRNGIGVVLGVALVIVGMVILGNMLGLWAFSLYFDGWWTLFIIVPCTMAMVYGGFDVFPMVGLSVGVLLLLDAQNIISFSRTVRILIPVAIIALGLRIIFRPHPHIGRTTEMSGAYTAILTDREILLENELFTGCSTCAVLGGIKLDLRNCRFEGESRVDVLTAFAGTTIKLPSNVRVISNDCLPVLGGVTYKKPDYELPADAPTLYISGVCAFGGVDIKQH